MGDIAKIKKFKNKINYNNWKKAQGLIQPWEVETDAEFEKTKRDECVISYKQKRNSIPIAYDKKKDAIVFYNEVEDNDITLKASLKDGEFTPIHTKDFVEYVCARRGAGKSYYVNDLIKNMNKTIDEKLRFIFISRLSNDESIVLPKNALRLTPKEVIPPDYEEEDEEEEGDNSCLADFKNSIMIFDDIFDSKLTDKMRKKLHAFIIDILENSRHFNIQVIMTSHMISNYRKTREMLNELSNIVVFPQFSNAHQIEWTLKEYFGIGKKLMKKLMTTNSRWVNISSIKPKVIITQNEIIIHD